MNRTALRQRRDPWGIQRNHRFCFILQYYLASPTVNGNEEKKSRRPKRVRVTQPVFRSPALSLLPTDREPGKGKHMWPTELASFEKHSRLWFHFLVQISFYFSGKWACLVAFNLTLSAIRYQITSLACPNDDRGNENINFFSWSENVEFLWQT